MSLHDTTALKTKICMCVTYTFLITTNLLRFQHMECHLIQIVMEQVDHARKVISGQYALQCYCASAAAAKRIGILELQHTFLGLKYL